MVKLNFKMIGLPGRPHAQEGIWGRSGFTGMQASPLYAEDLHAVVDNDSFKDWLQGQLGKDADNIA